MIPGQVRQRRAIHVPAPPVDAGSSSWQSNHDRVSGVSGGWGAGWRNETRISPGLAALGGDEIGCPLHCPSLLQVFQFPRGLAAKLTRAAIASRFVSHACGCMIK